MRRLAVIVPVMLGVLAAGIPVAHGETAFVIHKIDDAHFAPAPPGVVFLLAIGSDERAGLGGARGDALHLIAVNTTARRATMLDIPRDTYVEIPGHGRNKINSAYEFGGPDLEAATVSHLVGVPITYVITTHFAGFQAMVDEMGGIDINVPFPMNDPFSGARFPAGHVHMNGGQALAFSRNRHIPDGDLRRSEDQGALILAALDKLRGQGTSASQTLRYLTVLARHTRTQGMSLRDLYRLGRLGLSIDPGNVRNVVAPSRLGTVGAASVVFSAPNAAPLFADFRDDGVLQTH